jgi:peptidyl-prolyl cis-trans isomerase-like protein 2
VVDCRNIIPYVQKFKKNPVTGLPLALKDLIKLHFHKNADGEIHYSLC